MYCLAGGQHTRTRWIVGRIEKCKAYHCSHLSRHLGISAYLICSATSFLNCSERLPHASRCSASRVVPSHSTIVNSSSPTLRLPRPTTFTLIALLSAQVPNAASLRLPDCIPPPSCHRSFACRRRSDAVGLGECPPSLRRAPLSLRSMMRGPVSGGR